MSHASTRTSVAPSPASGAWRLLPTPRTAGLVIAATLAAFLVGGTGFGASSGTITPSANVVGSLSLIEPTAKSADPPLCTDSLAPVDTDDCTDVSFAAGPPRTLRLGSLTGADVQAGALTYRVTTTNPTGYVVHALNPGTAPLLRGSAGSIPDMPASPMTPAAAVPNSTHAGIAVGDPIADAEGAVAFPGSPWVTASGQQGELFRGVPSSGMIVAERTSAQLNDPFTLTLVAASTPSAQPPAGSMAGTINLVASSL